ncbi:MAG: Unknown protein [uncultured Campylobacterales bacterium]|uniref:Antitoxin n=1 Tax=uncultured Campylobacterales bacterium TaxID=352960 RepID=A0A6S6T7P9_9BACT|nr:MAG: Unknown protein [uncultured Campylobacterales bacterium]
MSKNNKIDYNLDEEEKKILEDIENNKYVSLAETNPNKFKEDVKKYSDIAKNTIKSLNKKKSLNLRVYENDIPRIRAIAMEKGLPYQTFLASIIHQIATKQIEI